MKVSSSQISKNKFIPFNKITKHNSISGTKPLNSKIEKFKIRGTNKILNDSSNFYSKANTVEASNLMTENSLSNTIIQKHRKESEHLPDICMSDISHKSKTPIRLRSLVKDISFTQGEIKQKSPINKYQSSGQSSGRENVMIIALKRKIKELSRENEKQEVCIKELKEMNDKNSRLVEIYKENLDLKKEIVHLKDYS